MQQTEYHQKIVKYYLESENAYKDSWDLAASLSIHYGYTDSKARTFRESLARMNEIMAEAAGIQPGEKVLDAGCGVGGSAIFLSLDRKAIVTGITLSERQAEQARENAARYGVKNTASFEVRNYMQTGFPEKSFDVVWGCESICYADNKEYFIREAFRLLKPGGRLVVADGFVTDFAYNEHPVNRKWLDGWQVNYLETPERFRGFMEKAGFTNIRYRDITKETSPSARRLYRFYFPAKMYKAWMRLRGRKPTEMQSRNIEACKYQYLARKKKLSGYGLIVGARPVLGQTH